MWFVKESTEIRLLRARNPLVLGRDRNVRDFQMLSDSMLSPRIMLGEIK